jgi:hypothetical protein
MYFRGRYDDLKLVHPQTTKRWVPIGNGQWGMFCDLPQPLACLYILQRRDELDKDDRIEINPISSRDALIKLIRYSFAALTIEVIGLQRWRLNVLAQLATHIPMCRIIYPSGLDQLARVREAIIKDCTDNVPEQNELIRC